MKEKAAASMAQALATGDVDAMRLLLQQQANGVPIPADAPAAGTATLDVAMPELYRGAPTFPFVAAPGSSVRLVNTRVMGKVVWPAGHALAIHLLETFSATKGEPRPFIEVGAGCGLPSFVVANACAQTFSPVVATDFSETCVQLLQANNFHNGSCLRHIERLEIGAADRTDDSLTQLMERVAPVERVSAAVYVCAAEIAYDAAVIDALFFSTAQLWAHRSCSGQLIFARSSHFAHMDERIIQAAACHRLNLSARVTRRAGGAIACVSSLSYEGCVDDEVEIFTFVPSDGAPGAELLSQPRVAC